MMKKRNGSSSGSGLGALGVVFNYAIARIAPGRGVHRLVSALDSQDEDTSTAAYMALVKLGPRVAAHLLDEARKGRQTANVLQVLGDQGDRNIVPELEEFARSADPAVASAARESLEALRGEEMDEN